MKWCIYIADSLDTSLYVHYWSSEEPQQGMVHVQPQSLIPLWPSCDVSASSCCSLIRANTCWVLSTCADWMQIMKCHTVCLQGRRVALYTFSASAPGDLGSMIRENRQRTRSWEGWSSMSWPHCLFPFCFKLAKEGSLKTDVWRCWADRRMKIINAGKCVWKKQTQVTEPMPSFEFGIHSKMKKIWGKERTDSSLLHTMRCLFPRQPSQLQQHSQSHEKRFMLNITHYQKMLISTALTDGPKKQISAVWWLLLGCR